MENNSSPILDTEKFLKWREGEAILSRVELSTDHEGYFIYESPISGDTKAIAYDLMLVSDCSPGSIRPNKQLEQLMHRHNSVKLVDKAMDQDCYFVLVVRNISSINAWHYITHLTYIYFIHYNPNCVNKWCSAINSAAYKLEHINGDIHFHLSRVLKLVLFEAISQEGVDLRNLVTHMKLPKDAIKCILEKLQELNVPLIGDGIIKPELLDQELLWALYLHVCPRGDIDLVYNNLASAQNKVEAGLELDSLRKFINTKQRDPRKNCQLFPNMNSREIKKIMTKYSSSAQNTPTTIDKSAYIKYLLSNDNSVMDLNVLQPLKRADLSHPLCAYLINSSHNTYLTGNQLTSNSTVEMYIQSLLLGARCIELDCWDINNEGIPVPGVTHGNTLCSKILFDSVIKAIKNFAFVKSDLPLILSFENHCSPLLQEKMARICTAHLGDLLASQLKSHPLKEGVLLPSPLDLKNKILIKNKRQHFNPSPTRDRSKALSGSKRPILSIDMVGELDEGMEKSEESEFVDSELSNLVNYVEPVKFKSFSESEEKQQNYHMSSFSEIKALELQNESQKFIKYNAKQTSRIYPSGSRIKSSNYQQQLYWNVGCQMAAINFQTPDLSMQINQTKFEIGSNHGYLLKPEILRPDPSCSRILDPFSETPPINRIPTDFHIRIISGQFLGSSSRDLYVQVELIGLPHDTRGRGKGERDFCTSNEHYNGMYVSWDSEMKWFKFNKIFSEDLALLRVTVYDDSSVFIAQRTLSVFSLQQGYRPVYLRDKNNHPIELASLFVEIHLDDHILEGMENYALMLTNPELFSTGADKLQIFDREEFQRKSIAYLCLGTDDELEFDKEPNQPQSIRKGIRSQSVDSYHSNKGMIATGNLLAVPEENLFNNGKKISISSLNLTQEDLEILKFPLTKSNSLKRAQSPVLFKINPNLNYDQKTVTLNRSCSPLPGLRSAKMNKDKDFVKAIINIRQREHMLPLSVQVITKTSKNYMCRADKGKKELIYLRSEHERQSEQKKEEYARQTKTIKENYKREIDRIKKELSKKYLDCETKANFESQVENLEETQKLKLISCEKISNDEKKSLQDAFNTQYEIKILQNEIELIEMSIPLVKQSHENDRQHIISKVHEGERKLAEKQIESGKIKRLEEEKKNKGAELGVREFARHFAQQQYDELERLQEAELEEFDENSEQIQKNLEEEKSKLELRLEQLDPNNPFMFEAI